MRKDGIILMIIVLSLCIILVLGGCSSSNSSSSSSDSVNSMYHDLNVSVVNNSEPLVADSITLLNASTKEVIEYTNSTNATQFTELETGNYIIVIGKEGYKVRQEKLYINNTQNLKIELQQGDSQDKVALKVNVVDSFGNSLDGVKVTVLKDQKAVERITVNGDTILQNIWPGVIYEYRAEKEGYSTSYYKNYLSLDPIGGTIEFSLNSTNVPVSEVEQYIFEENESKEVSLGTVAQGGYVIVGINNLELDSNNSGQTDGSISFDFTQFNSNLIGVNYKKSQISQEMLNRMTDIHSDISNLEQLKLDSNFRQQEEKLVFNYDVEKVSNSKMSMQSSNESYQLGAEKTFYVNTNHSGDITNPDNYDTVTATLEKISDHAYIFIDKNANVDSVALNNFINEFDNNIFSTNMNYFANYNYSTGEYDYDDNQKSIILITNLDSNPSDNILMGFFNPVDFYNIEKVSNKADMFYINSWAINNMNINQVLGTLAHEFQHLLFFVEKEIYANRKVTDTWINEGFAELAAYLNGYYGYQDDKVKNYFKDTSGESLLHWEQQLDDYGSTKLFALYLYEQFGSDLLKEVLSSSEDPVKVISNNYFDFADLFLDWTTANVIYDKRLADVYNYSVALNSNPAMNQISSSGTSGFKIKSSAVKYYIIEGDGSAVNLTVDLPTRMGITIYRGSN